MEIQLLIRKATCADYGELPEIWRASVAASHHFLRRADFLELEKRLPRDFLPAMNEIRICENAGQSIAFMGLNGPMVEMLFARPEFFGRGAGSFLLSSARDSYGPLRVDVNEQNERALEFYKRRGFTVIGGSPVDGLGMPYPILHMAQKG